MSRLERLVKKYGDRKIDTSDWFRLDPEDRDLMIRIPEDIRKYIDFDEGEVIEVQEVPEELREKVRNFKEIYRKALDPETLSEYTKARR